MFLTAEAKFGAICKELHANRAERKSIFWWDLTTGYGRRLGQALLGNTTVSELYLDLRPSQVNGENGDAEGFVVGNISMILAFLRGREGASLQMVTFGEGSSVYTNPCLQAISENPRLQDFILDNDCEVSAALLATWVGTTQTLQRLSLPVEIADDDQVAPALGTNSSITHLVVKGMSQSSKASFLDEIGRRATTTTLETIDLNGLVLITDVISALSRFATSSSAMIRLLKISDAMIDTGFSTFVNALSSRPCMIEGLELESVTYDEATATDLLASVEAQQANNSSTHNANASATTTVPAMNPNAILRKVTIGGHYSTQRRAEVKLVAALTLNAQFTLEELQWNWSDAPMHDMNHSLLWTKMEESIVTYDADTNGPVPFRRLKAMALERFLTGNNDAMFSCLSKLVSIRKLTYFDLNKQLRPPHSAAEATGFATAIRCNGSLTTFVADDFFAQYKFPWNTPTQERRVKASLQRNENLPLLLSRPPLEWGRRGRDHEQQEETGAETLLSDECRADNETIFPELFAVALPAQAMTPNFALMGLKTLSEGMPDGLAPDPEMNLANTDVGRGDSKRRRVHD